MEQVIADRRVNEVRVRMNEPCLSCETSKIISRNFHDVSHSDLLNE